jgi:hypothetical protein
VTVPPAPRGRKKRLIRLEEPPDELMLVIRATPESRSAAVEEMVDRALLSAGVYVVERQERRELLYGVSVFAHRRDEGAAGILERLRAAPMFVEAPVGVIAAAVLEVIPTGRASITSTCS